MEISYYYIMSWRVWPFLRLIDAPGLGLVYEVFHLILKDWTSSTGNWQDRDALRKGYETHNKQIKATVPKENLLEFHPSEGWEPLCKFLGKEAPKDPFPHINEGANAANIVKAACIRMGTIALLKLLAVPVLVGLPCWVAFKYGPGYRIL